jgi:hypothetical protein
VLEEVTAKELYESAVKVGELQAEYSQLNNAWHNMLNGAVLHHPTWHGLPEHEQRLRAWEYCKADNPELVERLDELAIELHRVRAITMMVTAAGWAASYERDSRLTRTVMQES